MFVKNGAIDERETEMMTVRWKVFNVNRQISQAEQQDRDRVSYMFCEVTFKPGLTGLTFPI